jgi:hypothetical protein
MQSFRLFGVAFLFAVLGACHSADSERIVMTTTTGAVIGGKGTDQGARRLAAAVCVRAKACGRIGKGLAYETPRECWVEEQIGAISVVSAADCVDGMNQSRLDGCVNAIVSEPCSLGIGDLRTVCAPKRLCGR